MILNEWSEVCWSLLTVRTRTLKDYKYKYAKHIAPVFGEQELESVTRKQVQGWILSLEPTVGKACLPILKTLYREALNYEVCESNPTLGIRRKPHNAPDRTFLLWDDLNSRDYGRYGDLFRFMALHGLRWGEVQALTQADIRDGLVYVNKSMYGPTKNAQSRVVPYMGFYGDFPKSYKWARIALRDSAGVTIHSLRYTYAYLLKAASVHPQAAQHLLGHSTITLTMDLYTKVLPDEITNAGDLLRNSLLSLPSGKEPAILEV